MPARSHALSSAVLGLGALLVVGLLAAFALQVFGPVDADPRPTDDIVGHSGELSSEGETTVGAEVAERDRQAVADERAVAAHPTRLVGRWASPRGVWPGGGRVELHRPRAMPKGGFLGLMSLGVDASKGQAVGAERKEGVKAWLGQADALADVEIAADGSFVIDGPAPGEFELRLFHPSLRPLADAVPVEIESAGETDVGVLDTQLAAGVLVLVSDDEGRPLPDARVDLSNTPDPSQFSDPSKLKDLPRLIGRFVPRTERTDASGTCRFDGLDDAGPWKLAVRHDGFVSETRDLSLRVGRENIVRVRLMHGGEVVVKVFDPDGQPYDGARIDLRYPVETAAWGAPDPGRHFRLTTDATGTATKAGLPDGTATLIVATAGYLAETQEHVTSRGRVVECEFRLDPGITVSGQVVDEDGQGIESATVTNVPLLEQSVMGINLGDVVGLDLLSVGMKGRGVPTDAEGRFTLGGLKPDAEAVLVASAEGYDPARTELVAAGTESIVVQLRRTTAVTGHVVADATGEPVPKFTARLEQRAFMVIDRPMLEREFVAGTFELAPAPRERLRLVVEADGFAATRQSVNLADGAVDVGEVRLKKPAIAEGTVVDDAGRPVAGARVRPSKGGLADHAHLGFLFGEDGVESDENGRFRIEGLAGRAVRLLVEAEGFAPLKSAAVRIETGEVTSGVVLRLSRGGSIEGRIVDGDGHGLEGWNIQLEHKGGRGIRGTKSDLEGRFQIDALAAGTYKVEAIPRDYMERLSIDHAAAATGEFDVSGMISQVMQFTVRERAVVRDGEVTEVELLFDDPDAARLSRVAVEGVVTMGGEPMQGGIVSLFEPGSTLQRHMGNVTNGSFRIEGVAPGAWRLRVQRGALLGGIGDDVRVRVKGGETERVEIDLPGGSIVGRVVHADGSPAGNVLLSLTRDQPSATGESVDLGEGASMSDANGRFEFAGLAHGTYHVSARELLAQAGGSARRTGILVAEGERVENVELSLGGGGGLQLTITDDGGPCANALVALVGEDGSPVSLLQRALSDPSGVVSFEGVPPGRYRPSIDAIGRAPKLGEVIEILDGQQSRSAVHLERGVEVRVAWAGETPEENLGETLVWRVTGPTGAVLRSGQITVPRAGAPTGGSVRLGRYAVGTYTLHVEGPRLGIHEVQREVEPKPEVSWEIDLSEF